MSMVSYRQKSANKNKCMWRDHFTLLILSICVISCSSISYKRGATPEAMTEDENICLADNMLEGEFQSCMRDNGWFITDGATIEKTIGVTKNHSPATLLRQGVEVRDPSSMTVERIAAMSDIRTEDHLLEPKINEGHGNKTMRSIASWWKIGGTANSLERDIAKCAGGLGEIHYSESGTTLFNDGMTKCLKGRGWHGIGI